MLIFKYSLLILSLLFLNGCNLSSRQRGDGQDTPVDQLVKVTKCRHYGGVESEVCSTSIYSLIVMPEKFVGKNVLFTAQVRLAQGQCFLAAPGFGDSFDVSSSIECGTDASGCDLRARDQDFVSVIGAFRYASDHPGVLQPAGKLDCLVVRGFGS